MRPLREGARIRRDEALSRGDRWGALGELGELFVNKERFDVYACPRCGQVQLFIDGIGEELRPH